MNELALMPLVISKPPSRSFIIFSSLKMGSKIASADEIALEKNTTQAQTRIMELDACEIAPISIFEKGTGGIHIDRKGYWAVVACALFPLFIK